MLLERSAQLPALQAQILHVKEKKRRYKAAWAEVRSRVQELEARLSHVPSPRSSVQLNFSTGMTNLLELDDSQYPGLPSIELEPLTLPIQEELSNPNNTDFYLYALQSPQGTVYQDTALEVTFSIETEDSQGTIYLTFKNLSSNPLIDFKLEYRSNEDCLSLIRRSQTPSSVLEPATCYTAELGLDCKSPFLDSPLVLLSYQLRSSVVSLVLKMPISVTRFVHPCAETVAEVEELWQAIKGNNDKAEFGGLRSDLRSLRAVAEVMSCAGAFHTYTPTETGIERTIIAAGQGLGSRLITRLSLNSSANHIELYCLCADNTLRSAVFALLCDLVRPNVSA